VTSKLLCIEHVPSDHNFYFHFTAHLYKLAGALCLSPGLLPVQIRKKKKRKTGKQNSATVLGYNCLFMKVNFFPLSPALDNLGSLHFQFEETLGNFCLWGKIFMFQTMNS